MHCFILVNAFPCYKFMPVVCLQTLLQKSFAIPDDALRSRIRTLVES